MCIKKMPVPTYESVIPSEDEQSAIDLNAQNMVIDSNLNDQNKTTTEKSAMSLMKIILLILLILVVIYLIFYFIVRPMLAKKNKIK